jgi:hypothetical protein
MQGQSEYTAFKYRRFGPVLAQSLLISKAQSVAGFPYYHVDLNAGSGMNTKILPSVPGSPLNFLGAVDRHQRRNFYAFFVDNDPACIRELIKRPEIEAYAGRVHIFQQDNGDVLPVVAQFIADKERNPHYAMGSILIDPNGYHKGVPWKSLRHFCHAHPRFDLFFNLNTRLFKLERSHIVAGEPGWATKRVQPISEFPTWFTRPNWMVTDECSMGGMRWVQLVGRTMQTQSAAYSSLGFYDYRSERGRHIIDIVEGSVTGTATQFPLLPEL